MCWQSLLHDLVITSLTCILELTLTLCSSFVRTAICLRLQINSFLSWGIHPISISSILKISTHFSLFTVLFSCSILVLGPHFCSMVASNNEQVD